MEALLLVMGGLLVLGLSLLALIFVGGFLLGLLIAATQIVISVLIEFTRWFPRRRQAS